MDKKKRARTEQLRRDPLVIFGSPRGGTSLVAGVFANHGFWTGRNYQGGSGNSGSGTVTHTYRTFENHDIKLWLKKNFKLRAGIHTYENIGTRDLRAACETFVRTAGPWMFKGPSEYFPIWKHYFPGMTPVFVFRDAVQAVEAVVRRRGPEERDRARDIILQRYAYMNNALAHLKNAYRVDCERIADGDFEQVAPIIESYGIEFDGESAAQHIVRGMLTR